MLTEQVAERFARVALANIARDYPRRVDHLLASAVDELRPRVVHPAFYGAYDWHSAVHMHWLLVRTLRLYPVARIASAIADALDEHLTPDRLAQELEYFRSPAGRTFERPYGWAWLLELQAEALRVQGRWARGLAPLAQEIALRMAQYVAAAPYPVRAGSHGNSGFACLLALDYARTAKDAALEFEIRKAARRWYERDRAAPLAYEPSLDDFLSPSLCEAVLMQQVLPDADFWSWLQRFAPEGFGPLAEPPAGYDHADPKHSHLDGLCLTRGLVLHAAGRGRNGREAHCCGATPRRGRRLCRRALARQLRRASAQFTPYRGSSENPMRNSSTARAHWRPSRIAQTTSDWPRRISPAAKTLSTDVL